MSKRTATSPLSSEVTKTPTSCCFTCHSVVKLPPDWKQEVPKCFQVTCHECVVRYGPGSKSLHQMVTEMRDDMGIMRAELASLKNTISENFAQIFKQIIPEVVEKCVEETIHKVRSLEENSHFLVVSGLPESDNDKVAVLDLCSKLGEPEPDRTVVDFFRMGKAIGGRPRLTKVRFKTTADHNNA